MQDILKLNSLKAKDIELGKLYIISSENRQDKTIEISIDQCQEIDRNNKYRNDRNNKYTDFYFKIIKPISLKHLWVGDEYLLSESDIEDKRHIIKYCLY